MVAEDGGLPFFSLAAELLLFEVLFPFSALSDKLPRVPLLGFEFIDGEFEDEVELEEAALPVASSSLFVFFLADSSLPSSSKVSLDRFKGRSILVPKVSKIDTRCHLSSTQNQNWNFEFSVKNLVKNERSSSSALCSLDVNKALTNFFNKTKIGSLNFL